MNKEELIILQEEKRKKCLKLGFKELPHFTTTNSLILDIGRQRFLFFGCIGTPNEVLYIYEMQKNSLTEITDIICLHNYDYNGYLSIEKLESLINWFKNGK